MAIYSSPVAFEVLEATLSLPNLFLYDKSIFHFSLNLSGVILYMDVPSFILLVTAAATDNCT